MQVDNFSNCIQWYNCIFRGDMRFLKNLCQFGKKFSTTLLLPALIFFIIGGLTRASFSLCFSSTRHMLLNDILTCRYNSQFHQSLGSKQKGLTEIELAEGVKIQLAIILDNICDIQLRHRVESLISFASGFVGELQQDQCARCNSLRIFEIKYLKQLLNKMHWLCEVSISFEGPMKHKEFPFDSNFRLATSGKIGCLQGGKGKFSMMKKGL